MWDAYQKILDAKQQQSLSVDILVLYLYFKQPDVLDATCKWSISLVAKMRLGGYVPGAWRANGAKCAERCPMGMGSRDCKQWPLTVDC